MKKIIHFLFISLISTGVMAQNPPFELELEPFTIAGLPGLHSNERIVHDGKWLIIGGRTNGLHGFQPPFAFLPSTQNTTIYVVDPINQQVWSAATTTLSQNIREHITTSNMEGVQQGNYYYLIGGYGFNTAANDLITFPNVTAIDVPGLLNAVITQQPISSFFRQITDQNMALSGSRSEIIDSTIYLVFGHRFDGRYNPHNMPTFTQTYSNQIQKFTISDDGTTFSLNNLTVISDTVNFHRRDYNLVPQIFPNGAIGLTAFSGVFQYNVDLPYLNSIDITTSGYTVNNSFNQLLSQYHSAVVPFYDSTNATMHSVFFGGMSEYLYNTSGVLVQDSLVPFVKTISYVSRNSSQQIENRFMYEMPGYLGSNMEFYKADSILSYNNGILKLDALDTGKVLIGYLFGGIESDYPYVFMNGGGNSWASDKIFKLFIKKNSATGIAEHIDMIQSFESYPNPVKGELTLDYQLDRTLNVYCVLYDSSGRLVTVLENSKLNEGKHRLIVKTFKLANGSYTLSFNAGGSFRSKSIVIENE